MTLISKIENKTAVIGIIGLGYVGLPLALEFAKKEFRVIGFDLDERKSKFIAEGKSYIKHIASERIAEAVTEGKFSATMDFTKLPEVDAIIICVPTPLDEHREPDMSYIENSAKSIAQYFRKGQLVVLESSTYPGTTEEILLPLLENSQSGSGKLIVGEDFYLAFSPEREDPNNANYSIATIPKVIGGMTPNCLTVTQALYNQVIVKTVAVSSPKAAEATKLLENIYRSINIALVNELKLVFDRMGIDVWEVIEAAKTKPFGFHAFYPGPGLGGHCIPIDPFYLTWKAREYDINTKFIELAGEINTYMPYFVIDKTADALNNEKKSLKGSKVLILGASYKKDIDDMRESPSLKLIEILRERGCLVDYNDPYVPKLPKTRKYDYDMESILLTEENLQKYDVLLLSTDHSNYDYKFIADNAKLIVDTRNAFARNGIVNEKIVKA